MEEEYNHVEIEDNQEVRNYTMYKICPKNK